MIHDCACRWPRPGPMYWDWRCLTCDGRIRPWWHRRRLRKAQSKT